MPWQCSPYTRPIPLLVSSCVKYMLQYVVVEKFLMTVEKTENCQFLDQGVLVVLLPK